MTTGAEVARDRFCRVAAPILLCLVAAVQIARVLLLAQTPWKGGGFGMFASIDRPETRFAKAYLLTDRGEMPALVPALPAGLAMRTTPTPENLGRLADELGGYNWVRVGHQWVIAWPVAADQQDPADVVPYSALRVELWRSEFDAPTGQVRASRYLETIRPKARRE
jgi:hypothetical protein